MFWLSLSFIGRFSQVYFGKIFGISEPQAAFGTILSEGVIELVKDLKRKNKQKLYIYFFLLKIETEKLETITDHKESTDKICKTFKKYSSRDTIPLNENPQNSTGTRITANYELINKNPEFQLL
jgi:hypothetical protein